MKRTFQGAALLSAAVAALAGAALAAEEFPGVRVTSDGDMGVGVKSPLERLHVDGNSMVEGTMKGSGYQGRYRNAAVLQGFSATGQPARFALKYNYQKAGNTSDAIEIHNVETDVFKTFIIPHPKRTDRYLVHATLEGPEGAVFYRGSARLRDGEATVHLPDYFEALTRKEERTITLTKIGGFDDIAVDLLDGRKIRDGKFRVIAENPESDQAFDWEVKAVRADKPKLEVEPKADEVAVGGVGPYTYARGQR